MITDLHNSNKPLVQVTLFGEIIPEEQFHLLGFVTAKDLNIETNICLKVENLRKKLMNSLLTL